MNAPAIPVATLPMKATPWLLVNWPATKPASRPTVSTAIRLSALNDIWASRRYEGLRNKSPGTLLLYPCLELDSACRQRRLHFLRIRELVCVNLHDCPFPVC